MGFIIERPFAFFIGAVVLIAVIVFMAAGKKPVGRIILSALFIGYLTAVISVTIFPIIVDPETMTFSKDIYNIIPFSTIGELLFHNNDLRTVLLQVAGNIVMCIPFGVAFPLLAARRKKLFYLASALIFPMMIEMSQLLISVLTGSFYRTIDTDDVILNFAGILIGYGIFFILPQAVRKFFSGEGKAEESSGDGTPQNSK